MKKLKYILTIMVALAATTLFAQDHDHNNLDSWLMNDCGSGDASAEEKIASYDIEKIESQLEFALQNGPRKDLIVELRQHAGENYDRNMNAINSGKVKFMSERQIESVKSVSKEDFVDREENSFVTRYKDQARIGLELIDKSKTNGGVTMSTSPNPANAYVNFSFILPETANYTVELYSASGKLIGQINEGSATKNKPVNFNYNTASLPNGVYLYKVVTNADVYVEKFVIKR